MKTAKEIIEQQSAIIREVEHFFKLQDKYFLDRSEKNLDTLRTQQQKCKQMIFDSKPPVSVLRKED